MKRLTKDNHIYVLDPKGEPAITIASGEELIVETWDAFQGLRDPAEVSERTLKGPATGPIYVEGAAPGDALKIDLMSNHARQGGGTPGDAGEGVPRGRVRPGVRHGHAHRGAATWCSRAASRSP